MLAPLQLFSQDLAPKFNKTNLSLFVHTYYYNILSIVEHGNLGSIHINPHLHHDHIPVGRFLKYDCFDIHNSYS